MTFLNRNNLYKWGSGTWYPLDGAPGDVTEHIIAQASVTTLSFAFK